MINIHLVYVVLCEDLVQCHVQIVQKRNNLETTVGYNKYWLHCSESVSRKLNLFILKSAWLIRGRGQTEQNSNLVVSGFVLGI